MPSSAGTENWPQSHQQTTNSSSPSSREMIPTSSFYDPENVSDQTQQFHAQRYQEWIDSYAVQQQQQQHSQQTHSSSSYSHFGTRDTQNQQFNFFNRLEPPLSTQIPSESYPSHSQTQLSDVYGYYNNTVPPSQSYSTGGQHYSHPVPQAAPSNASSHSPVSLTGPTEDSVYPNTSTHPNPTPSPTTLNPPHVRKNPPQKQAQYRQQTQPSSSSRPSNATTSSPSRTTSVSVNGKRKRGAVRKSPGASAADRETLNAKRSRPLDDSDDDSDDDEFSGISVGMGGLTGESGNVAMGRKGKMVRLPGACTHCKKLKMKCDFPPGENTCKRCKTGGHACIVEGRKPRTAPNKREYLLAQIRQKDAIIESLLKQLHNPYLATPLSIASYRMATSPSDSGNRNVLAWLERLQSSVQNAGSKGGSKAFKLDSRDRHHAEEEDSEFEETNANGKPLTHAQRYGLAPIVVSDNDKTGEGSSGGEGDDGEEENQKLRSSLPDSHVPLGLIANLSLSTNTKARMKKEGKDDPLIDDADLDDDNVGVANNTYFMPGPATDLDIRATLIEQHSPPEILVHGLVTPDDVDRLFDIFYNRVNPFVSMLDPALHTPATTFARCPFLFTVICAVSSRYYAEKSEIYPIAMHFAKHSAANALVDGWKSVELCQAYMLMSIYAVPARRWEEDRSWLYTGLAIRIATDLNLHQLPTAKPHNEKQERENLNRQRVWMMCFNLDRSTATQFGKPSTIKEDYLIRSSAEWYTKSKYNLDFDVHLCGHTALLRIVAKFHEEIFSDASSPSGLNKRVDFLTVTLKHDEKLSHFEEEWTRRFTDALKPGDRGAAFRCSLLPFLAAYSRLVMWSFGFQQAYQRGVQPGDNIFLTKCLESAKAVITCMVDSLAPSGYMRYAPDGHFIFASFASAFLLKLLRPEFSNLLPKEEGSEIYQLIGRLIQTLSSPSIAIDDRHTPKLYARFLAGLLSHHRRDGATVGRLQPLPPPTQQFTGGPSGEYSQNTGSSMTTFSGPQPGSSNGQSSQTGGYNQGSYTNTELSTPIYRPEVTYAAGAGPIQFDVDPMIMDFEGNNNLESDTLATMQALKNPNWWTNMMMPGFSWPDSHSSPSNSSSANSPTPPSHHHHANPNPTSASYGIFHVTPQQIPGY